MADDLHLPYPAEASDATAPPLSSVTWNNPQSGQREFRRKILPFGMQASFDPANGNRMIVPYRIRSEQIFNAIPCILGWSKVGGVNNTGLRRRTPVQDEEGFGMVAVRIPSIKFHASSKIKPGGFDNLGNDTYDSRIYGDVNDPSQPGGPMDSFGNPLPEIWKDDPYQSPDTFTDNIGFTLNRKWRGIKQTRWATLNVEFAHVPYDVLADQTIDSGFGGDEKNRFMWAEYIPSIEYITSKAIVLKFAADADAGFANNDCGTEGGFARPTGELIVHWHMLPADGVGMLFSRFEDDGTGPRYGCVNSARFDIRIFGQTRHYAPETLMFHGCRAELRYFPYGPVCYDLHYHFNYRYGGWNKFLTGATSKLQHVVRKNGDDLFRKINFDELFLFA